MNETQSHQHQSEKPNPCNEPGKPKPENKGCNPPCPAEEDCPDKKRPCPCPPEPSCPPLDPCAELPPEPPDEEPEAPEEPTPESDECGTIYKPTDQLAALQTKLVKRQKVLRDLQPAQLEVDDLTARIAALQEVVNTQAAKELEYKIFYRAIEVTRSEIECFIPTVRCQLELKEHQKRCVCQAIDKVDRRIAKVKGEAQRARLRAQHAERRHKKAEARLAWATRYHTFVTTDLKKKVEELKAELLDLKGKADPANAPCETYFYLYELERLIKAHEDDDASWQPDLNIGTYVDRWHPDCYALSGHGTLAAFNEAEAVKKLTESRLQQATTLAETFETAAANAEKSRRADILLEIASERCCDPDPKCSPKESTGREAR